MRYFQTSIEKYQNLNIIFIVCFLLFWFYFAKVIFDAVLKVP